MGAPHQINKKRIEIFSWVQGSAPRPLLPFSAKLKWFSTADLLLILTAAQQNSNRQLHDTSCENYMMRLPSKGNHQIKKMSVTVGMEDDSSFFSLQCLQLAYCEGDKNRQESVCKFIHEPSEPLRAFITPQGMWTRSNLPNGIVIEIFGM